MRVPTLAVRVLWVIGTAGVNFSPNSSFSGLTSHPIGIGDGVAEHVEEGGLEEGVELGEGLAALGPQGVRRIQNPRNPLLLGERREGDLEVFWTIFYRCLDHLLGRSSAFALDMLLLRTLAIQ